ncbi:hypothetical protein AMTRI_Chr04g250780 [Amborella trichopoda]
MRLLSLGLRHLHYLPSASQPHSKGREGEQACLSLVNSCTSLSHLTQLHSLLIKTCLNSNLLVVTRFIAIASHLSAIGYASALFSRTAHRDTFLFNTMIRCLSLSDHTGHQGLSLFSLMLRDGITPNKFTFPVALKACSGLSEPIVVPQLHSSIVKFGFNSDLHIQNTLIHAYGSCGDCDMARQVFDGMTKEDTVSWSAMIGAFVRCGFSGDAIALFREMQAFGVVPDEITVVSVLGACTDVGALGLANWVELYVEKQNVKRTIPLCNALIDTYAKCGSVEEAWGVFNRMQERSVVSWTAMIDGLASHGRATEALMLFSEMQGPHGVSPDGVAYLGVLSACSHASLVDEGWAHFREMQERYGLAPKAEYYGCVVDMLGRAGLIDEAYSFVKEMPIEPNPIIWRALLNACRVHGKLEFTEQITKRLIASDPTHGSNYVILSNIYASQERWGDKARIRDMMSGKGIRKVPGCSSIEINNTVHEFVAGDKEHFAKHIEMYGMLEEIGTLLRMAGHVPHKREVLLDIDEEDKEGALRWHSEKLALAFGLVRTRRGTPLRIVKNLRVCRDCHSAFKVIAEAYEREITVRDGSRFHLFKGGSCSCRDYW